MAPSERKSKTIHKDGQGFIKFTDNMGGCVFEDNPACSRQADAIPQVPSGTHFITLYLHLPTNRFETADRIRQVLKRTTLCPTQTSMIQGGQNLSNVVTAAIDEIALMTSTRMSRWCDSEHPRQTQWVLRP